MGAGRIEVEGSIVDETDNRRRLEGTPDDVDTGLAMARLVSMARCLRSLSSQRVVDRKTVETKEEIVKAQVKEHGTQFILVLTPDTPAEVPVLQHLAEATNRAHIINFRGFQYMSQEVEFLVQPYSGRD